MALIKTIKGLTPIFGKDCYLSENATVVGDVTMGDECSVWFGAIVRGDVNFIRIGHRVNIQDGSCLHTLLHKAHIVIGNDVTIGHNVTLHGAHIGNNVLIGMGATLLDNCEVDDGAIVAAGALVLSNTHIGKGELWGGVPAKFIKKVDATQAAELNKGTAAHYIEYAGWYTSENPSTLVHPTKERLEKDASLRE